MDVSEFILSSKENSGFMALILYAKESWPSKYCSGITSNVTNVHVNVSELYPCVERKGQLILDLRIEEWRGAINVLELC